MPQNTGKCKSGQVIALTMTLFSASLRASFPLFKIVPGDFVVPERGTYKHDSCVHSRDPGEKCGLDCNCALELALWNNENSRWSGQIHRIATEPGRHCCCDSRL